MRARPCLVAVLISICVAAAQEIDPPTKTPAKTRPEDAAALHSAIEMHDHGDYEGAIRRYTQILNANPDDVTARYELTFSYFAAKQYRECIETAKIGIQYDSPLRGRFFSNMGSCLDESGKTDEAVKLYRAAIAAMPTDFLLPFNLGITLARQKNNDEARALFEKSIANNPSFPGAHLQLGHLCAGEGRRIPAVLALSRFLILEPDTARSAVAFQDLNGVLDSFARTDPKTKQTSVTISAAPSSDGDFLSLEATLAIALTAAKVLKQEKEKPMPEPLVPAFQALFAAARDQGKSASDFWRNYYLRYFADLDAKGLTEPFVYVITMKGDFPGASSWMRQNWDRVRQLLAWSKAYDWSAPAPAAAENK